MLFLQPGAAPRRGRIFGCKWRNQGFSDLFRQKQNMWASRFQQIPVSLLNSWLWLLLWILSLRSHYRLPQFCRAGSSQEQDLPSSLPCPRRSQLPGDKIHLVLFGQSLTCVNLWTRDNNEQRPINEGSSLVWLAPNDARGSLRPHGTPSTSAL